MEIVTKLTLEEYLRFICSSRGVRVKKDSEFAGYTLTSMAGEIGYGFATKEEAFRDFCSDESEVDIGFIASSLEKLTLREGDEIATADGRVGFVAEIFSKSGLIESPKTKLNISDGNSKVFNTMSFEDLCGHSIQVHAEFNDALAAMETPNDFSQHPATETAVPRSEAKKASQFSFNF